MKFWDLVRIANRNLLRNKLRTILTILAIFVGSFTLVMTNGLADGMRDFVDQQVKSTEGDNILFVRKKFDEPDAESKGNEPPEYKEVQENPASGQLNLDSYFLTVPQIEAVKSEIPEIKTITPRFDLEAEYLTLDGIKKYVVGLGMLSEGVKQKVEVGRSTLEAGEIIIPLNLAQSLNPEINQLIGKTITVGYRIKESDEKKTISLSIAGVATKGLIYNFFAFVDAKTARQIYDDQQRNDKNYNKFSSFTIQLNTANSKEIAAIKTKLESKGLEGETFADRDKRGTEGIFILQMILGFFAFIALLAASFGIINTLVVAVMERTREIGLQKAMGMGRWKIFALFSLESVLIGFWGAMCGVIIGILVGKTASYSLSAYYADSFEGYNLFSFHLFSIAGVILLVCLIAFLAGVLPAFRASRLNPIEALRYE
jgi:putative ABC transport system permease protein